MSPDVELMLIFGGLHIVALLLGGVLFVLFLRSDPASWDGPDEGEDGGGGGNDRLPSSRPNPRPTGGIPLPDAEQASRRLRGHERLRDGRARPRRVHPPIPPRRTPAR